MISFSFFQLKSLNWTIIITIVFIWIMAIVVFVTIYELFVVQVSAPREVCSAAFELFWFLLLLVSFPFSLTHALFQP